MMGCSNPHPHGQVRHSVVLPVALAHRSVACSASMSHCRPADARGTALAGLVAVVRPEHAPDDARGAARLCARAQACRGRANPVRARLPRCHCPLGTFLLPRSFAERNDGDVLTRLPTPAQHQRPPLPPPHLRLSRALPALFLARDLARGPPRRALCRARAVLGRVAVRGPRRPLQAPRPELGVPRAGGEEGPRGDARARREAVRQPVRFRCFALPLLSSAHRAGCLPS